MEDSPINKAHSFAAAAEEYAERHNWSKAVEAHFRAAEQFLLAINYTSDLEATRTLKLMYANHTRQGKELQRRVATAKPKNPTVPLNAGTATTATTTNTSSSSTQSQYPTTTYAGSPATAAHRRSATRTFGAPVHTVSSNAPHSPSLSAPAKLRQQPNIQTADHRQRQLTSESCLPPNSSNMRPSNSSPSQPNREIPRQPHAEPDPYDLFRLRLSDQGIERQEERSLIDTEMLMDEGFHGKRGMESSHYTKHGLPNTGHAVLPVQSLDASVIQPPTNMRGTNHGSGIEESYLVLKGKDEEEDEDSDPFNKFWEVVENLVKKISNPVAFATAPLGVGPTGGTPSLSLPRGHYQTLSNGPTPRTPPNSMHPKLYMQETPIGGVSDARQGAAGIMTTAELMPPPTMWSRSAKGEGNRVSSTGSPGRSRDDRSIAESAYFIVPGQQRNNNEASSSAFQTTAAGRGSQHLGPGLVNTSQIIMPEGRVGGSGKTLEEYAIENQQLKITVDFLSRKVAGLERAAEENTMLKSSIYQFRQDVSKQAKRIMQSQEIMRSSALGHRTSPENSTVNAHASKLQKRIKELEFELKQAKQENEKQNAMMAKYRDKWEKLKEAAKKKRSGGPNLPPPITSNTTTSSVHTHIDTNLIIPSQQSSSSPACHVGSQSKIGRSGVGDNEKLDDDERKEGEAEEGETNESVADSVPDLTAPSVLSSSLVATPKARHQPFSSTVSTLSEDVTGVDVDQHHSDQ